MVVGPLDLVRVKARKPCAGALLHSRLFAALPLGGEGLQLEVVRLGDGRLQALGALARDVAPDLAKI